MNSTRRIRTRTVAVVALAMLASLAALPAQASSTPQVSGVVTGADGSGPIAGIKVCAEIPNGEDQCTTSGADGGYFIKLRVAPVRYHAYEEGLYGHWVEQLHNGGQVYNIKSTTVHHVNFALQPGATISGVLTPPADGPRIDFTHVTAFRVDSAGKPGAVANLSNVTASGDYIISKLPAGTYKLEVDDGFSPVGYRNQWYPAEGAASTAVPVTVGTGQVISGKNISLTATGSITINLAKPDGSPAQGTIDIYDADGRNVFTGDGGHESTHTIVGLHPGAYKVHASAWGVPYSEWYSHKRSLATANSITVTSGDTSENTLVFHYPTLKSTSKPTVKVGDAEVTASKGKWSPSASSYRYDWLRDGKVIRRGSSANWYVLSKADVGHRIKACVTASRTGYASSRSCSDYSRTVKSY